MIQCLLVLYSDPAEVLFVAQSYQPPQAMANPAINRTLGALPLLILLIRADNRGAQRLWLPSSSKLLQQLKQP